MATMAGLQELVYESWPTLVVLQCTLEEISLGRARLSLSPLASKILSPVPARNTVATAAAAATAYDCFLLLFRAAETLAAEDTASHRARHRAALFVPKEVWQNRGIVKLA
jgi:hypothetical protein